MKRYIPYDKLSKKAKRDEDKKKRVVWSDMGTESPVTKVEKSKKVYSRKKSLKDLQRTLKED